MNNELFINSRYTGDVKGIPTYVNHNGILKKYISSRLASRIIDKNNKYYKLSDLSLEMQERFIDIAVSVEELAFGNKKQKCNAIYDSHNTLIYPSLDTLLLPVVGTILPDDGIPAFTVTNLDEMPKLEPIIICWDCHWSELFSGITKYKNNVFCLASDLTAEQREFFINDIIPLIEVKEYLNPKVLKK